MYNLLMLKRQKKVFLIMKMSFIICSICFIQISASVYSQNGTFTIETKNTTMRELFHEIEQQSQFRFFYNDVLTNVDRKVSIDIKGKSINDVLDIILANSGITYRILDNQLIVVSPASLLQQLIVTGKVTDTDGNPLPGASVVIKGTVQGTVTDADGAYSLSVPDGNTTLVFSFVGYASQEITVGSQRSINITMSEDARAIEEVVVIGYGSVRKNDVTGSIVSVNTDEMMKRNPVTVGQGLQGAAAGVAVYRNSGNPSGSVTIRIRGIATVNNSADPLFVVDGIQAGNDINFLNPNDIESIEILKDASAAAIYGSKGANGVILVTTKRGLKGKTRLNFSANYSFQTRAKTFDMLNTTDFVHMARESVINDGTVLTNQAWVQYDDRLKYIDWQKEMTHVGVQQNYNLNVTGGNENSQGIVSIGYANNDGLVIASNFKRLTARANMDHKIKDFIRTGLNINFTHTQNYGTDGNDYRNMVDMATVIPTMDAIVNGQLYNVPIRWDKESDNPYGTGIWGHFLKEAQGDAPPGLDNPVALARTAQNYSGGSQLFTSAYIDIDILKNLTFRTVGGFSYNNGYYNSYTPLNQRTFNAQSSPYDQFYLSESNGKSFSIENYLTYNLQINQSNRINLMAGWSVSKWDGQWLNVSSKMFPVPSVRQISLSQDLSTLTGDGGLNREDRAQSFFGRAIYSLLDRYVFTGTIRRDGSSNFGAGNRYGTFPSASILWRTSEEEFMKNQNLFSKLNVRLGWGLVGNAGNSTNLSVDQLSSARIAYYFYNTTGMSPSPITAPGMAQTREIDTNLKWEANVTKNVNIEMGFLQNSLTLSVEYFIRDTKDLLLYRNLRPSTGYDNIYTNAGQIRNSGFEFFAVYQKRVNDWSYNIKLNGSTLKNKVIDVGDPIVSTDGAGINEGWDNWSRTMNGYPIASFYGYRVEGIFQNQAEIDAANAAAAAAGSPSNTYQGQGVRPGDFKFKDLPDAEGNKNGYITEEDREILGNGFPKLNYGLNAGVSYKNWDVNVFLYGIAGQQILSYAYKNLTNCNGGGFHNVLKEAYEDAWRPNNPNAKFSLISNKDQNQNVNMRASDFYVMKGDFLRIQNLQIGYSFPRNLISQIKMENARVYVSIENLVTITGYKGGDPEIGGNLKTNTSVSDDNGILRTGFDAGRYPFPRTFIVGLSIGF